MKPPVSILAISYGRTLFDAANVERLRLEKCAEEVEALHVVVFSKREHNLTTVTTDSGLVLHPTNSRTKLHMLFDAIKIGSSILADATVAWVITAQDPFETSLVGYRLKKKYNHPLNIQEHADFFTTPYWRRDSVINQLRYYLGIYFLRKADTVRVVSERIKQTVQSLGVQSDRILYLPVRTDALTPATGVVDLHKDYLEASVIILSMARFVTQKNLPLLITAFAAVHTRDPKALLILVGQGPEEQRLRDQVVQAGIVDQVVFLPWTENPQAFMQSADIYALSSNWEGWARVLIEAMAAGTPVITTDVGCANQIVIDNTHGFVTPVADMKAYTKRLVELVENVALREQFGAAGKRDVVATHVSPETYSKAWAKVLFDTHDLATDDVER